MVSGLINVGAAPDADIMKALPTGVNVSSSIAVAGIKALSVQNSIGVRAAGAGEMVYRPPSVVVARGSSVSSAMFPLQSQKTVAPRKYPSAIRP